MRAWLRWLPAVVVPAVIATAVIATGALAGSSQAGAAVDLPAKTPEQVLAMIGQSTVRAFSGTVEQTSQLGLPKLPVRGASPTGAAAALELLAGAHTARVYVDGPTNLRVQVMDTFAERDVVRHGTEVWLYSSDDNTATRVTLPADTKPQDAVVPDAVQTPTELAHLFLAAIDPSTAVTIGPAALVAGRTAYDLVLTPRTSGTLVGSVSIAVDSATGLPLSVEVQARGQDKPAFGVAFTSFTLGAPAPDRFQFVPPPGAVVKQQVLPALTALQRSPEGSAATGKSATARPTITGTGWDAVVELPAGTVPAGLTSSPLLGRLTQAVTGGRLAHTALLNLLLTDDGRVFLGSVPVERLQAVAAGR